MSDEIEIHTLNLGDAAKPADVNFTSRIYGECASEHFSCNNLLILFPFALLFSDHAHRFLPTTIAFSPRSSHHNLLSRFAITNTMSSPPLKRPTPPTSENGSIEESPTKRLKVEGDSGNESRVTTRPGSVEGQVEGHIEGQVDGHIEVHIEGRIEGQIEEQIEQNEVLEYGELEENSEEVGAIMVNTRLFDDDPRRLLERSVALVLDHIGFDSASKEAMEALCCEVDTCKV